MLAQKVEGAPGAARRIPGPFSRSPNRQGGIALSIRMARNYARIGPDSTLKRAAGSSRRAANQPKSHLLRSERDSSSLRLLGMTSATSLFRDLLEAGGSRRKEVA